MRVFFAIEVPEEVEAKIAVIIQILKSHFPDHALRWVKPRCFHVTLQFLKELNPLHMASLNAEVRKNIAKLAPFTVTLGPLELFPTAKHPRLISLVAQPHEHLAILASEIGHAMKSHDYTPEIRPFRGHLTLGRFNYNTAKHPCTLPAMGLPETIAFTVKDIVLFQSQKGTSAMRYVPLESIPLAC